ncbi:spore germination protein [Bacillus paranthracis]
MSFLCGLTDKDNVYKYVVRTLQYEEIQKDEAVVQTLLDRFISIAEVGKKTTLPDIINAILAGDTVILIDNIQTAIVINSRAWEKKKFRTASNRRFNTWTENWIK